MSLKSMLLHMSEVYLNINRYLGCSHFSTLNELLSCCDIFVCLFWYVLEDLIHQDLNCISIWYVLGERNGLCVYID